MMNKIISGVFILITVCSIVIFPQKKEYTVEAIQYLKENASKSLNEIQWIAKGEKYSFIKYDTGSSSTAIFVTDVRTGEEKLFVSGDDLKLGGSAFNIQNYSWSPDEKYILFTGTLTARSLKTGGAFYIYDVKEKKFFLLADSGEQMNANFSPDGNKLAFVRDNNVFVTDIKTGKELQVTSDGSSEILNGHSDWVYEEEFGLINGIKWSPDSKSIAFWRFDQTPVPEIQIAKWDSLHFNFLKYHYPKAGDDNSLIKIGIANAETGKTLWADLGNETDIYIPRIEFTNNPEVLSVQKLNRYQNKLELLFVETSTGKSNIVLTDTDSCWLEIKNDILFLKNKNQFICESTKDGFNHLYLYDYSGKLVNRITKGNWEVDKILGVDESADKVYYSSSEESPLCRNLYSVDMKGENKICLTKETGTHEITFNSGCKYFIDKYSNINTLPKTILCAVNGEKIRGLIKPDMTLFNDYGFYESEFIKFKTSNGTELNASMIKPANFDSTKKYPVLMYCYGGPGSQSVLNRWDREIWHQLLAQKGYVVFVVDNRGTGGRGKAFRNLVYKNLGSMEAEDQIEGAKYLASLKYIDAKRIGIWGWSYGGYLSAMTVMKGAEFFKAAVSVAPVTDWRFYDNIYTERYMSLPKDNAAGYTSSAVLNYVDRLGSKFLLVHGTADDNVHFQNSVTLVDKLIKAGKQFETMYYPGKEHSIRGSNTRIHLYKMITNFILNNL